MKCCRLLKCRFYDDCLMCGYDVAERNVPAVKQAVVRDRQAAETTSQAKSIVCDTFLSSRICRARSVDRFYCRTAYL